MNILHKITSYLLLLLLILLLYLYLLVLILISPSSFGSSKYISYTFLYTPMPGQTETLYLTFKMERSAAESPR